MVKKFAGDIAYSFARLKCSRGSNQAFVDGPYTVEKTVRRVVELNA